MKFRAFTAFDRPYNPTHDNKQLWPIVHRQEVEEAFAPYFPTEASGHELEIADDLLERMDRFPYSYKAVFTAYPWHSSRRD